MFDWLGDIFSGIGNAIGSTFEALGEQISNVIWNTMLQWLYSSAAWKWKPRWSSDVTSQNKACRGSNPTKETAKISFSCAEDNEAESYLVYDSASLSWGFERFGSE